jgi:hypothetical protein
LVRTAMSSAQVSLIAGCVSSFRNNVYRRWQQTMPTRHNHKRGNICGKLGADNDAPRCPDLPVTVVHS